jgi:poly-gamma-glutamate capsule biosynthesis protein CapA/YwtB (metallophosphatase superfamily)
MIKIRSKKLTILSIGLILTGLALILFIPKNFGSHKYSFNDKPEIVEIPQTTLFFAGDIMLSRNVAAKMYTAQDFSLPFINVSEHVAKADISFANLESPFNDQGDHSVEGSLNFNADPKSIEGLNYAGFDVISTANNHSYDQEKAGINFTYKWLNDHGITPIGTTPSCHMGTIITKNNIKFGFLAYSYAAFNDGGTKRDPLVCDANDLVSVAKDIQLLKTKVDFLIVSAHLGTEYKRSPDESSVLFAHKAIDSGADLMIGHHPHWIQTTESYKGKWIFYSLGNFVFDQMWSQDTREGLTVNITFQDKLLDKVEVKPVIIENYCCPRWATLEETKSILRKIGLEETTLFIKK